MIALRSIPPFLSQGRSRALCFYLIGADTKQSWTKTGLHACNDWNSSPITLGVNVHEILENNSLPFDMDWTTFHLHRWR
jgi:hypothetical protein